MRDSRGYIFTHRKILDWEWYSDVNTCRLFQHLHLVANHSDKKFRGETIKRGECAHSLETLAKDTGLTVRQVRTSLSKLRTTRDVTRVKRGKLSLISITNYISYQDADKIYVADSVAPASQERHENDTRMTQSKECKELKECKEEEQVPLLATPEICPATQLVEVWNQICGKSGLPIVKSISKKRRTALKARWNDELGKSLETWEEFCQILAQSRFCHGENERRWVASIDWAMRPDTITKQLERKGVEQNGKRLNGDQKGGGSWTAAGFASEDLFR